MNNPVWPPDRIEALKRLWWDDGLTASQAAAQLGGGATRNAVIGRVHRLVLSGEMPQRLPVIRPPVIMRRKSPRKPHQRPPRPGRPPAPAKPPMPVLARPQPQEPPVLSEPTAAHVSVMDIRADQCRFPFNDPKSPEFRFCGAKIRYRSYCEFHARIVYLPVQRREKAA